ncbi:MAG: hypothetical protein EHM36_15585, partial [Deltaproteobacteria bacterium]
MPAPHPLPHVSPRMEHPDFWISKTGQPGRLLLRPGEIEKMNEENLKKPDLWLCRIQDLKEEWSREELLALLKEDWDVFGSEGEVRYGKDGAPFKEAFWSGLRGNLNQEGMNDRTRLLFGLTVKEAHLRVFPTEEPGLTSPSGQEFDRFQHSSLSPGSLVGVYYFSRDGAWAYIQAAFIRGWVRTETLGIARERKEAVDYDDEKNRLVVTGNSIPVYGDAGLQETIFRTPMGTSFPLVSLPDPSERSTQGYVIKVPVRETDGRLSFRKGHIALNEDVSCGFLPYTQENACRQAFKMLHHPYSWGDRSGGRDCSRFIMDLFAAFGIVMPRNSKLQARIGIAPGQMEEKGLKEKKKALDRAIPFVTTLRLPGHIMLYLGKEKGRYYAIHSVWGIERRDRSGSVLQKIGKTDVTDLGLGHSGSSGSLLDRIT